MPGTVKSSWAAPPSPGDQRGVELASNRCWRLGSSAKFSSTPSWPLRCVRAAMSVTSSRTGTSLESAAGAAVEERRVSSPVFPVPEPSAGNVCSKTSVRATSSWPPPEAGAAWCATLSRSSPSGGRSGWRERRRDSGSQSSQVSAELSPSPGHLPAHWPTNPCAVVQRWPPPALERPAA